MTSLIVTNCSSADAGAAAAPCAVAYIVSGSDDVTSPTTTGDVISGSVPTDLLSSGALPLWQLIVLGGLAALTCAVTVAGNLVVILSFVLERSIRQTTNYFIASLAVSDLLIGAASMPLYTVYLLAGQRWPLGETLCDLWLSLDYTACLCSIYTVFCITVDRYCSVRIPARYRKWRTERKVCAMVATTWVIPAIVFFTSIIGWQYFVGHRSVPEGKCYVQYMDNAIFNCLLQVGYFWATLVVMCALYGGIYRVALRLHRKSEARRRKMAPASAASDATYGSAAPRSAARGPRRPGASDLSAAGAGSSMDCGRSIGGGSSGGVVGGGRVVYHLVEATDCVGDDMSTCSRGPFSDSSLSDYKDFNLQLQLPTEDFPRGAVFPATVAGNHFRPSSCSSSAGSRSPRIDGRRPHDRATTTTGNCAALTSDRLNNLDEVEDAGQKVSEAEPKAKAAEADVKLADTLRQENCVKTGSNDKQPNGGRPHIPSSSLDPGSKPVPSDRKENSTAAADGEKLRLVDVLQHSGRVKHALIACRTSSSQSNTSRSTLTERPTSTLASLGAGPNTLTLTDCQMDSIDTFETPPGTARRPFSDGGGRGGVLERRDVALCDAPLGDKTQTGNRNGDDVTAANRRPIRSSSKHLRPTDLRLDGDDRHSVDTRQTAPCRRAEAISRQRKMPRFGGQRLWSSRRRQRHSGDSEENNGDGKLQTTALPRGSSKQENRARKSLRTITIILGAFVICWTPWHILSLLIGFCPSNSEQSFCGIPYVLYDVSYWLCYINSPINPFCYALANQQFRRTFLRILRRDWHRT